MPTVKVEMRKGKSAEYKRALLDGIHRALVENFKTPEGSRTQRLYELDDENFEIASDKTSDFILIELTVIMGRSYEVKKNLYKSIADNLEQALGINRMDMLIILNELPLENWGVRGGIPATEANLSVKLNM